MSENPTEMLVRTETSVYKINLEQKTVVRNPQEDFVPSAEVFRSKLRRDDEEIALISIQEIKIGRPMVMILDIRQDGIPTARQTTIVTEITYL